MSCIFVTQRFYISITPNMAFVVYIYVGLIYLYIKPVLPLFVFLSEVGLR